MQKYNQLDKKDIIKRLKELSKLIKKHNIHYHKEDKPIITDKNFAVIVKVGNEMQVAIFKPTNGKYGILEGVLKSSLIKENDIIYTSSISEIFPPDIPVCKVININNDQDKPYLNIQVEILANLNNLNYVFIIQ